jgi:hypothetical protein
MREPIEIMNPNSISHRLFVAALTAGGKTSAKPAAARPGGKNSSKVIAAKTPARAARKLNEWSWSGWQHTTI